MMLTSATREVATVGYSHDAAEAFLHGRDASDSYGYDNAQDSVRPAGSKRYKSKHVEQAH